MGVTPDGGRRFYTRENTRKTNMNNFTFHSPTEFVFGKATENQAGALCKKYGATKVLVVYGGQSAIKSGLLQRVIASLDAENIPSVQLGGIRPNPTDPKVYEGIELARKEQVDFILAVGGGSVIDTAKAICLGVPYEGDFWDFFIGKAVPKAGIPVATVLTIPAAGSEGSGNAVITREETLQKLGAKGSLFMRPKFSIMNPELTFTLPEWQTASGIADMVAHLLERYLSNSEDVMIGDRLCEGVMMAIIETAPRVMESPEDYGARANIMWSGMVAHNDTCSAGRVEEWSTHAMEHELSALYDVTHGAGLAVMFPAYLTFMAENNPHKVAQLAMRVFGVKASAENAADLPAEEQKAVALEGANCMRKFFKETLRLPVTIAELGITDPDIDTLVRKLHENKGENFGTYYPLNAEVTRKIYEIANV